MLVLQRIAVQRDSTILLPESRGKLVHDAAVHPHEVVLRVLGHLHELQHRERTAVQGVESHSGHHLDGGGGGERSPDGQVAAVVELETAHGKSPVGELLDHAERVIHPAVPFLRQFLFANREFCRIVFGDETAEIRIIVLFHSEIRAHVERGGEDEPTVVVGVVTDEVHAPGGEKVAFGLRHNRNFCKGKSTIF